MSDHDARPKLSRRKFLAGAGAAGAATVTGLALADRPWASAASHTSSSGGTTTKGPLVLVTLYGGNDGLNTVIPYTDPAYRAARPNLGYTQSEVLPLSDGLGLNSKLHGFHSLWQSGQLAVVRGVSYPNPSLSHFSSMAIWQTANVENGDGPGWLGRWLDTTGDGPMRAISIGTTLPPALRGNTESATAINSERIVIPGGQGVQSAFAAIQAAGPDRTGLASAIATAGRNLLDVETQLDRLVPAAATGTTKSATSTDIGSQLQVVADLIKAGSPTQVYQVSLSSFDTHADEKANHERLLGDLDAGVAGFFTALHGNPHAAGVVLMTYSEFGRRPAENASGGTDHGTAAPLFIAGPKVRGGRFYGEEPSLTALDSSGNLSSNVDFRSVYATMLERVIGVDPARILGGTFPIIDVV